MDTVNPTIHIFNSSDELFLAAANDFKNRADHYIKKKGKFIVALSGGNTPKAFFAILASMKNIPWPDIIFFFCDERYVSSDSLDNNYCMANLFLFSKVAINPKNIYRISTNFLDPEESVLEYEKTLNEFRKNSDEHLFDVVYLGLGENAHTASLMPGSDIVKYYANQTISHEHDPLVAALFVFELNMYRITLTPTALKNSDAIIFLVVGQDKEKAVQAVLKDPYDPVCYPAQLFQDVNGKITWYLDEAAATMIDKKG